MTDEGPVVGQDAEGKKNARKKTLTSRTVTGAMWTSAGAGAEYVLHAVIFVILARLLSPQDFGIYALATVVVGLSRVFGEIGLGPALVQRRDLSEAHITAAFTTTLLLSIVTTALIAGLAPLLADLVGNVGVAPVIRFLSLLFVFRGLGLVAGFLLQRNMRLSALARTKVISYLLGYGVVGVSLAFFGLGYWALVWAALCEAGIQTIQVLFLSSHSKRLHIEWPALKQLLSFGVGSSVGRLGNYLAMKGDYLVVGRFLGVGPLGLYSRAYELMAMPVGLYQTVAHKAFFSAVAIVQDDKERLSRAHSRTIGVTALAVIPFSIGLCILAPELIEVVLGARWSGVVGPFQVLAVGMFFRSGYTMSEAVVKGTGHVHALALRQGIYATLVVAGAWSGHFFGVPGVAAGVLVAMVVHFAMVTQLGLRFSGLKAVEFAAAHLPGVMIGGLVLIASYASATILRGLEAAPWLILISSLLCSALLITLVVLFIPRMIGPHGAWAIESLKDLLKARRIRGPSADVADVPNSIQRSITMNPSQPV